MKIMENIDVFIDHDDEQKGRFAKVQTSMEHRDLSGCCIDADTIEKREE